MQSNLSFIRRNVIFCSFLPFTLLTFSIFSGLILTSSTAFATDDSVTDEASVTVPVSCSLIGTGMNSHNAEISNGTYQADIGTTTLKAFCNDNAGFAIYAAGYTGNEIGGTNSNKLVGTTASSNATIDTGTATSAGNPDTSNWAMKLTTVSSPTPTYPITLDNGFGSYSAVPNSYTKVAHRDSNTDIGVDAEGTTLTTTYAAYISKTQPADTYSGQVIYTLVHPASEEPLQPHNTESGHIAFYPGPSSVVGTMGSLKIQPSDTSVTLLASNYSRQGYGFAGWSDAYDYATNPYAHFFGPNETITFTAGEYTGTNPGLSLYAVWVKSEGSLQDNTKVTQLCGTNGVGGTLTTAPIDGTANLSSVSALTDQRDNETYAIARLADGNCWMIENLRLEAKNTRTPEKQALAQGYGSSSTYGNFGGLADAESDNFSNSTIANSLYYSGTQSGTASIDIGASDSPGYRMPRYNNWNNQSSSADRPQYPSSNSAVNDNTRASMYSYGNYYTWSAAVADVAPHSSEDLSSSSICPAGWRLPRGKSTTTGFGKLDVDMGGTGERSQNTTEALNRWRKYPVNILYSGRFNTTSDLQLLGLSTFYWSSYSESSLAYSSSFIITDKLLHPGNYYNYNNSQGFTIRCTMVNN